MKRHRQEGETGMMNLPMELQALILLHHFHFEIKTVKKWHKLQKIFRVIPQFGKTSVADIFYRNLSFIPPELFEIFYTLRKYPPLRGLTSLRPTDFIEQPHLEMLESMNQLSSLDLSIFNRKFDVHSLTNLTSLSGNSNLEDDDMKHLTNLTKLELYDCQKITDNGLKNLTNLTEIDVSDRLCRGNFLTSEVFLPLSHLKKVSFSLEFPDRGWPRDMDLLGLSMKNITTLDYSGDLSLISPILPHLANLLDLTVYRHLPGRVELGYFSKTTSLNRLAFVNCFYWFTREEILALCNLKTLSFTNSHGRPNRYDLPNFWELSNITELFICFNNGNFIMDECRPRESIMKMTKLSKLSLRFRTGELGNCLTNLVNLSYLDVVRNTNIRDYELRDLTNLKRLDISACTKLSRNAINRMTNLETLGVFSDDYKVLKKKVKSLDSPRLKIIKIY